MFEFLNRLLLCIGYWASFDGPVCLRKWWQKVTGFALVADIALCGLPRSGKTKFRERCLGQKTFSTAPSPPTITTVTSEVPKRQGIEFTLYDFAGEDNQGQCQAAQQHDVIIMVLDGQSSKTLPEAAERWKQLRLEGANNPNQTLALFVNKIDEHPAQQPDPAHIAKKQTNELRRRIRNVRNRATPLVMIEQDDAPLNDSLPQEPASDDEPMEQPEEVLEDPPPTTLDIYRLLDLSNETYKDSTIVVFGSVYNNFNVDELMSAVKESIKLKSKPKLFM